MVERLIVSGLINSTDFLQQVRPFWEPYIIGSRTLSEIAQWCIAYYDEYEKAPGRTIEDIFYDKKKRKEIVKDLLQSIEEDLEDLSYEYEEEFNLEYALKRTNTHIKERHFEEFQQKLERIHEEEGPEVAAAFAAEYKPPSFDLIDDLDLGQEQSLDRFDQVFNRSVDPLIKYPGSLGKILNDQLVRGAFVSLMASEKRGKSFWLLDMALRAVRDRHRVAFFQAGDMTEGQQLKRIASYLTKLPTNEKYTGIQYYPVADCLKNQLDLCDKEERRCGFGVFEGAEYDEYDIRENVRRSSLIEAYEDVGKDYLPCTNCEDWLDHRLGTPWLVPKKVSHVVTADEAKREATKFFLKKKRHFKISTHSNNTLTVSNIRNICNRWNKTSGFVPDVIVIDYADLLVAEHTKEFRHAQNEIWKNLRALSQDWNCLVLTATQADAKSYDRNILKMSNYSEDKRKYAHVTAMFGLNQDKHGREKQIGVMRINQLVIREGEFDSTSTVTILQDLNSGHPFLDSYT